MRRRAEIFLLIGLLCISISSFGQKSGHFYNVDAEVRVEGTIQKIVMEPRYKDTSPFLIVLLEEKNTQKLYQVEISPVWFFDHDFHKGEYLVVTGSLYSSEEHSQNIIAREILCKGETLVLRDKHGFPNWSQGKGQMKRRGKRKVKRY